MVFKRVGVRCDGLERDTQRPASRAAPCFWKLPGARLDDAVLHYDRITIITWCVIEDAEELPANGAALEAVIERADRHAIIEEVEEVTVTHRQVWVLAGEGDEFLLVIAEARIFVKALAHTVIREVPVHQPPDGVGVPLRFVDHGHVQARTVSPHN